MYNPLYDGYYYQSTPRELEFWREFAPHALIPTFGVIIDPEPGQSSCRGCWRCKRGDSGAGKHPKHAWKHLENGFHPKVIGTYLKAFRQDPTSCGWALATGRAGLVVLDVDKRHGGLESLQRLIANTDHCR